MRPRRIHLELMHQLLDHSRRKKEEKTGREEEEEGELQAPHSNLCRAAPAPLQVEAVPPRG